MSKRSTKGTGLARALTEFCQKVDADAHICRNGYGADEDGWMVSIAYGAEPNGESVGDIVIGSDHILSVAIEKALAQAQVFPCVYCGWENICGGASYACTRDVKL